MMLLRSICDFDANIVHQRLFLPSGAWMHAHSKVGAKKGSGDKHSEQEVFIHNSCEGRPLALYVLALLEPNPMSGSSLGHDVWDHQTQNQKRF